MRQSNNVNLLRFAYRDVAADGPINYLDRETIMGMDLVWGFGIENGIYPASEPSELSFTIGFPRSVPDNTQWDTFQELADIGHEVVVEVLQSTLDYVYDPVTETLTEVWTDDWTAYGPTFYIKSMTVMPDVNGGLKCLVVCEDLLARAMNVPVTWSDTVLTTSWPAFNRFWKLMEHIGIYYDGIYPQLDNFKYNDGTTGTIPTPLHSIYQPAITGGAYTAESASGILNGLLRLDLAFIVFNEDGYDYRNIYWYATTPSDPVDIDHRGMFNNLQTGYFPEGYGDDLDRYLVSEMNFANDNAEVISCLRVELASDPTNYYSWQDAAAILKYGAKYVKEQIDASPVSSGKNSVDVWGKAIAKPDNTQRITDVTFSGIGERSGRLKHWAGTSSASIRPGRWVSASYFSDHFNHGDHYVINKVSHTVNQNQWTIKVELWKPSLKNGWA